MTLPLTKNQKAINYLQKAVPGTLFSYDLKHYYTSPALLSMGMYACSECGEICCIDRDSCLKCGARKYVMTKEVKVFESLQYISQLSCEQFKIPTEGLIFNKYALGMFYKWALEMRFSRQQVSLFTGVSLSKLHTARRSLLQIKTTSTTPLPLLLQLTQR